VAPPARAGEHSLTKSYPSLGGVCLDGDRQRVELNCLSEIRVQRHNIAGEVLLELLQTMSDAARRRKIVVAHCSIRALRLTVITKAMR